MSNIEELGVSTYFVVKCMTLENLMTCIQTGDWAYRDRLTPPQPGKLLAEAHRKGKVVLIFSVNNQHGWHGYCESLFHDQSQNVSKSNASHDSQMCSEDANQMQSNQAVSNLLNSDQRQRHSQTQSENTIEDSHIEQTMREQYESSNQGAEEAWHYFKVKWLKHFQEFSKQECLSSSRTSHLCSEDGNPINKARNWQEISSETGRSICTLIDDHHQTLKTKKLHAEQEKLSQKPQSFFIDEEGAVDAEIETGGWNAVIQKVENELGKVHLACPFGSQRYNCNQPESDSDIFLVYQAKTRDVLSLDPPKQTIKNSETAVVDYTVLEIQRYCELLVSGDPRCVETLYLDEETVLARASDEWRELKNYRDLLLTRSCFDKYMKECQGTTGMKRLQKWHTESGAKEELTPKHSKLSYIVLRLLQNARDLAVEGTLHVFKTEDSQARKELMAARKGEYSYSSLTDLLNRYLQEIECSVTKVRPDRPDGKAKIQQWLLELRIRDLEDHKICQ